MPFQSAIQKTSSQTITLLYGVNVVGRNIAAIRRFYGLSQAELARAIGRDRQFIQRIENGGRLPAEYLETIAIALKLKDPFALTRNLIAAEQLPVVTESNNSLGLAKKDNN